MGDMTASTTSRTRTTSAWRVAPGGLVWAVRHGVTPSVVVPYLDERPGSAAAPRRAATVPEW